MVRVNLSRQSFESVAEAGEAISVTRQSAEVLAPIDQASAVRANLSRISFEVIAQTARKVAVTRQHAEVMAAMDQTSTERVNLSRVSFESIVALIKRVAITRQSAEVMAAFDQVSAEQVKLTRMSFEVLSRKGPNPVEPLALAAGVDLFLHNWSDQSSLETAWLTDVQQSANDGAEERRGLSLKPLRTMTLLWSIDGRSEADRMLVLLRKIAQQRFQVPLYMDQTPLTAAASSGTATLTLDTSKARFFIGARVVIVRRGRGAVPTAYQYNTIGSVSLGSITLETNLTASVRVNDIVLPMIDCEIMLAPKMKFDTAYGAQIKLTCTEVAGASQLPAHSSGNPLGFELYRGMPIFQVYPNWIAGLDVGISRQGERYKAGRTDNTYIAAARGRLTASYFLTMERDEDAWTVVEFFDTRRGRLRSFWLVDQDQIWEATACSTSFLDIDPFGELDNFEEEMDFIALVMKDGTTIIREVVNIQSILGVWRITPDEDWPSIDIADISRIARARKVRFDADTMQETWMTDNVMTTRLDIIECLEEKDVEL